MLKQIKNYINKSEFTKNVLVLTTGTSIAQFLPIAISPILTRIYSPEDFGVLTLFTSIVMIFAIIGNGRYELAIILPKKDSYAINIWALTLIIAFFISIILLITILFFHDFFVEILNNKSISVWLYIVPLVVFFISIFNSLNYFYTREKKFKTIAIVKIVRSAVMSIFQLILYFIGSGVFALIGGYVSAQFIGAGGFLKELRKKTELLKKINKATIYAMARRYKRFPQYTMTGSLFNRLTIELPNIFISLFFNTATLGFYSLSYRILSVPSALIGMSIGQIYLQEANNEKQKTNVAIKTFKSVIIKLVIIGLPSFIVLFFTAEWLFAFIFGEEWRIAGQYAKIVSPLLFVNFVISPVSVTLSVFEEQAVSLFLQFGLLVTVLISFLIFWLFSFNFISFLYIFVSLLISYNLFFLFILYKTAQSKLRKNEKSSNKIR